MKYITTFFVCVFLLYACTTQNAQENEKTRFPLRNFADSYWILTKVEVNNSLYFNDTTMYSNTSVIKIDSNGYSIHFVPSYINKDIDLNLNTGMKCDFPFKGIKAEMINNEFVISRDTTVSLSVFAKKVHYPDLSYLSAAKKDTNLRVKMFYSRLTIDSTKYNKINNGNILVNLIDTKWRLSNTIDPTIPGLDKISIGKLGEYSSSLLVKTTRDRICLLKGSFKIKESTFVLFFCQKASPDYYSRSYDSLGNPSRRLYLNNIPVALRLMEVKKDSLVWQRYFAYDSLPNRVIFSKYY
jgi:hypothetical protein